MRIKMIVSVFAIASAIANAQNSTENRAKLNADLGVDLVSNYIWRGTTIDPSPNIQGWGEVAYKNLTIGSWASVNFNGNLTETDVYLRYATGGFSLTITDYFMATDDYYNFENNTTLRTDELMAVYDFGEKFPLKVSGGVILFGNDKKIDYYRNDTAFFSTKNNLSSYIELKYPVKMGQTEATFTTGFSTHESYYYGIDKFACVNIGIGISKAIKISDSFSLPLAFEVITNPNAKTINSILKISF